METTKEKHATFTPGPWELVQERDYLNIQETKTNLIVAQFCSVSEANARLIAAAPKMLDALKNVKRALGMPVSLEAIRLLVDEAIHKAEAKVEGGEG
tara:strand:+ start:227 stop:517 length:291 start_codon:yes stop_codon:yes gene_type:complete